MDFSAIIDEIALEGLEGITTEALWKRLEDRPGFVDGPLDDDLKDYIWKLLTTHRELQFFALPEPRPELIIFKYNSCIKTGHVKCALPSEIPLDIYSRTVVDKNGVMGCCDHFKTRKNVTEDIRGTVQDVKVTLQDAVKRWGQALVIVASQRCRNMILQNSGESLCTAELYSLLELIGRARYDGEVTFCLSRRGLCNPQCKDFSLPGNTHTRMNVLGSLGLITKQEFIMTYHEPDKVNNVRLVHLKQFYTPTNANHRGTLRSFSGYLSKFPNKTALFYDVLRDLEFTPESYYRAKKHIGSYFSIRNWSRKAYFQGDANADRKNAENERFFLGSVSEQKVKTISLRKVYQEDDQVGGEDDDDDDDDDEETLEDSKLEEASGKDEDGCDLDGSEINPGYPSVDDSLLGQVASMIYQSGSRGVTASTVKKRFCLTRNNMKYIQQELAKSTLIGTIQKCEGTVRVSAWVRHDIEEKLRTQTKDESEAVNEKTEKATISVLGEEVLQEESKIDEEEVAALDARLKEINVTCTIDRVENKTATPDNDDPRKRERKMFILNHLAAKKIITSSAQIYQVVIAKEMEKKLEAVEMCFIRRMMRISWTEKKSSELDLLNAEQKKGIKERLCRKSLKRILNGLYSEGRIEFLNVELEGKTCPQMIILPGAGLNNVNTKRAVVELANAKLKFKETDSYSKQTGSTKPQMTRQGENFTRYSSVASMGLISVYKILTAGLDFPDKKMTETFPKSTMCNISKMERTESLHEYLHYMLYGYKGCKDSEPEKKDSLKDIEEPIPVYLDVEDWRRYLPPLHLHNASALKKAEAGPGTCMTGDIMLHMPLGKVLNILNRSSELAAALGHFMEDPQLEKVPMCLLPKDVLLCLLGRKRFLARIQEDLNMLCQLGLLSYGPRQRCTNLEFNSIHLHKRAVLIDTRSSLPSNLMTKCPEGRSFPVLRYNLDTAEDLAQYWIDLQIISLNTKLGRRKCTDIPGTQGDVVPLLDATKPKAFGTIQEQIESIWLPGDRRGAAGMDSYLMMHLARNWRKGLPHLNTSTRLKHELVPDVEVVKEESGGNKRKMPEGQEPPTKIKNVHMKKRRQMAKTSKATRWRKRASCAPQIEKPKKNANEKSNYSESSDAKDQQARKVMSRLRSSFTALENGHLMLCQLAACILHLRGPGFKGSLVRDILQEYRPESCDKTAHAVKGRLLRLQGDQNFNLHLATYLAQAKSDK
ncbi:general transcription factor 3c polypeptide, partial [Plakobranchus ocellatus]